MPRRSPSSRLLLVACALAGAWTFASGAPAAAQGTDGDDGAAAADDLEVFGVLDDDDGEPVEGVTVVVRTPGGDDVGEAVTDESGAFAVALPASGTYEVELLVGTLPEGVALRDADDALLDNVVVFEGRAKRVAFPLGEGTGGAASGGNRVVNLLWGGIKLGLVIALASIGLSLIFGTTGLVNFAHGELVTFGALAAWFFNSTSVGPSWPLALAGLAGVVVAGAFGAAQRLGIWRPLERRRTGLVSMMIMTIGLGLFLRHVYEVVFDANPRPYAQYGAQPPWEWGPLTFPPKDLWLIGICVVALAATVLALERTRFGTAVRAVADNRSLAASSGIDVDQVVLVVWVSGAALAGLGGIVFGVTQAVQWDMGFRLLLIMFAAVILGGLGSIYGPIIGGLVIGLVSEMSTYWFPTEFKVAWALAVLVVVLLVRPQGIIGVRERIG